MKREAMESFMRECKSVGTSMRKKSTVQKSTVENLTGKSNGEVNGEVNGENLTERSTENQWRSNNAENPMEKSTEKTTDWIMSTRLNGGGVVNTIRSRKYEYNLFYINTT